MKASAKSRDTSSVCEAGAGQGRSGGFCRTVHRRPLTPRTARQSGESEARTLQRTRKRFACRQRFDSFRILRVTSTSHLFGRCCDHDSLANSPPWRGGRAPNQTDGELTAFTNPEPGQPCIGAGGAVRCSCTSRNRQYNFPANFLATPTAPPFSRDETPTACTSLSIPGPCPPPPTHLPPP